MPNLSVGQIIQVRAEWELYGQRDLSVWHYRINDVGPGVEMFGYLKDTLNAYFLNPANGLMNMLAEMSNAMTLTGVVSQVIRPTRYRPVRTISNQAGGSADPAGTNNVALSVGFGGDLAGRGRSGRTQVPGLPKKWMTGAKWDVAVVTAMQDHLESFRVGTIAPGGGIAQLRAVLYSAKNLTHQDITTIQGYSTVRTMRRRTYGVGQ